MIRVVIIALLSTAVSIFLQSTWLTSISFLEVVPDLSLVVLVFFSLFNGSMAGQVIGFLSGFLFDALSPTPFGFSSLVFLVIGNAFGSLRGKLRIDPIAVPCIALFMATLLKYAISFLVSSLFGGIEGTIYEPGRIMVESGYNALVAPIVFLAFSLAKRATIADPARDAS